MEVSAFDEVEIVLKIHILRLNVLNRLVLAKILPSVFFQLAYFTCLKVRLKLQKHGQQLSKSLYLVDIYQIFYKILVK